MTAPPPGAPMPPRRGPDDPTIELPPSPPPAPPAMVDEGAADDRAPTDGSGRGAAVRAVRGRMEARAAALADRARALPLTAITASVLASVAVAAVAVQTLRARQATTTAEALPEAIIGGLLAVGLLGLAALTTVAAAIVRLGRRSRATRQDLARLVEQMSDELLDPRR